MKWMASSTFFPFLCQFSYRGGVSANSVAEIASGYREPTISTVEQASRNWRSSSSDRVIRRLPRFSLSLSTRVVPGIGKISTPCAINHASVNCDGVTPLLSARHRITRTNSRFFAKFSLLNRGANLRKSFSSNWSGEVISPLKRPRPSGE